jgi:predicted nuclease of restriction endonuclease-like RecB superfamily
MLTADLVDARKKGSELVLRTLDAEGRIEALAIGRALLDASRDFVGKRREELEEAWDAAIQDATTKRFKLAAGLRKLATDACSFEAQTTLDPIELRRALFTRASELRRASDEGERFDRASVVAETAAMFEMIPEDVERALFSDLRSEHVVIAAPTLDPASLVEAWELGQAQAVLLAAVRITCEVYASSPGLVRELFAKLKFHKLLFSAERIPATDKTPEGWKLVIDGPYSMFDAVTKYGVRLALAFPALRSLERWSLVADVRWGKTREALEFRLASDPKRRTQVSEAPIHQADDVRELMDAINAQDGPWRARPSSAILDVPGSGICVPDLELSRKGVKKPIYVEVLGYWSRDAVFRRVELVERGLGGRVIFAVSSRLRVSEAVLDESASSSLYVYKGKMSPRAILAQAERLDGT